MMRVIYIFLCIMFMAGLNACGEEQRFEISADDNEAPGAPEYLSYKPLIGGARIFYNPPTDKDVLSVNAEYINNSGEKAFFRVILHRLT